MKSRLKKVSPIAVLMLLATTALFFAKMKWGGGFHDGR